LAADRSICKIKKSRKIARTFYHIAHITCIRLVLTSMAHWRSIQHKYLSRHITIPESEILLLQTYQNGTGKKDEKYPSEIYFSASSCNKYRRWMYASSSFRPFSSYGTDTQLFL
jgi:hypothetical protein